MLIQQFFIDGIAHSSYLLAGDKNCYIIDPARDIDIYLAAAAALDLRITGVLETHLHADFISGHLELAERTGARIYAPKAGKCKFEHAALAEGDVVVIDNLTVSVLETPGHTPEHVSYVIVDTSRGPDPVSVFCGDTLFVGDVGRPDLFPDVSQKLASGLYDSLYLKLLRLPDFCEVYPAHGAGSLCGRSIGAKRSSTIGYEKRFNESLNLPSREEFIHTLTTNMPAAPDHFNRCSDINRVGPVLLKNLPRPVLLAPREFRRMAEQGEHTILDVRSYEAFGSQFISHSYHNDIGGNFAVFAGWVLPPQQAILLIVNEISELERAVTGLRRVGLDNITGYLDGGLFEWSIEGLPAEHIPQLSAEEVHRMINTEQGVLLLDVRTPAEYERFHIEGAYHIPVPDLRQRYRELDTDSTIIVMCSTGRRSSMAASILNQHGFRNVFNAAGGMTGYHAAGYSRQCPVCSIPHGPRIID